MKKPKTSYRDRETAWSPTEMIEEETSRQINIVERWYRLTAIPEAPRHASVLRREASRKSRLLSTAVFFLMVIIALLIPATLFIPNRNVLWLCLIMMGVCLLSLIINRAGRSLIAGTLVVLLFEIAFFLVIVSTRPFDVTNLPLYDMLVLPELLAASLLPGRSIFIAAIGNSAFIWAGLVYLPRSESLDLYLNSPLFYTALIRPVVLQILVAIVVYIWVRSTLQAIERADKAEMLARLEHALAEQKQQLEMGVQEILRTHTAVSNGELNTRTPLTQDHILWPLANALNTLLARFQRAVKAEQQLQQVQVLLPPMINVLQEAEQQQRPVPQFQRTGTPLDPLFFWLSGKMIIRLSSSPRQAKSTEQRWR